MSAITFDRITVEPPASRPVSHLSVSSLNLYRRCPEAFKRKYIDHEREQPNGKMLLGGAAGAALAQHYARQLEALEAERGFSFSDVLDELSGPVGGLSTADVLDEFSAEWDLRAGREEVLWGSDAPGALKDSGIAALVVYHTLIAPGVVPVAVEREIELTWPDAPFTLTGYLDLETADGQVCDFKLTGQRWSQDKADAELQPTVYLAARRAEGNPATGFQYHALIRTKKPNAEIVPTERTDRQLDLLTDRVFTIARSIEWRWLNNCWEGAGPDVAWLCRGCAHEACDWRLG